jgi:hypothetical protein
VPEQQSAQQQVAQRGLVRHDPAQLRHRNSEHATRRGGNRAQESALPGEDADLAEELGRAVAGDDARPGVAMILDDVGCPGQQHDQVVVLVAVGEEQVAGPHVALGAVTAQHSKLSRVQHRGPARLRDQAITAAAGQAANWVRRRHEYS